MGGTRRDYLKHSTLAGIGLAAGAARADVSLEQALPGRASADLIDLKLTGYRFEHVQALIDGSIQIPGCRVTFEQGKIGDLNTNVFAGPQSLDVTEIGLIPFILAYANDGFRDYSLLPVFPLRLFRHKSVFVHADRGIERPQDLKGRRVGTPGYSSTSLTWIRGFMQHEYGVAPSDIHWVVSAADSSAKVAGAASQQENVQPEGITIEVGPPGKDESQLLLDGDVDALFHAAEPQALIDGNAKIKRLFADPRAVERDYYARTGIFPIMHAVAIRNTLIEAHPWLPSAVFDAYSAAKTSRYEAMRQGWLMETLPWFGQEFEETRDLMGENFWPYGIGPNRTALTAMLQYAQKQGLASRRLQIEDLFHPSTLALAERSF